MKKMIMMAAMLLAMPILATADDAAWGEIGGGSLGEEKTGSVAATSNDSAGNVCGQDDARMANLIAVLKDLKAGKAIDPMQLTFGTYMDLSDKVRSILGDNIVIVSASCKKQFLMDGELTGKVEMPFPEVLTYINGALRARDRNKLKFIFANVKAAPDTLRNIMGYSVAKSYPLETGKILASIANIQPSGKDKTSIGIVGLSLYGALGGRLAQGEDDTVYIFTNNMEQYRAAHIIFNKENDSFTVGDRQHVKMTRENSLIPTEYLPSFLIGLYGGVGVKGVLTRDESYTATN